MLLSAVWPSEPLKKVGVAAILAAGLMVLAAKMVPTVTGSPQQDAQPVSLAEAWAQNMAQLGIRPIYPPTEDFHVGDLWAVVANPASPTSAPIALLARGARIGHHDLRTDILDAARRRPLFSSDAIPFDVKMPRPNRLEASNRPEAERIPLAVVGFPTIDRTTTGEFTGALGGLFGRLSGDSRTTFVEQMSVPHAVGYGIDPATAAGRLAEWCYTNLGTCNRRRLTAIIRIALGPDAVPENVDIDVVMVSYVFATQAIEFKRQREDARGATVAANGTPGDQPEGRALPDAPPTGGGAQPPLIKPTITASATSRSGRAETYTAVRTFERPVAIGFRAVTIAAPPEARLEGISP